MIDRLYLTPLQATARALLRWCLALAIAIGALVCDMATGQALAAPGATYTIGKDAQGQTTIVVAGEGAVVTLADIQRGLSGNPGLLQHDGATIWQLNANVLIERNVTLNLTKAAGVGELRLRSQRSPGAQTYVYSSFVYLRTDDGTITIDGVKVYSWDPDTGTVDTDVANGRSYILAKYAAHLNISNAELSYLGSGDGESYGVSWRDTNDTAAPRTLRTRVTGTVLNSQFHHNYYGVYTFQASAMIFRGNTFFQNIHYGFDPHDYSHHFIVEDNQSFANGSHGFIISRGCNNFVFRRNSSHDNNDPDPIKLAHGFMLDPGSPNSSDPQAPSSQNLLENNQAYANEGYGLRILGSTDNAVQNNLFRSNRQGLTVEEGSTGNTLLGNTIDGNALNGIFIRGGANATTVSGNSVTENGGIGIYVKSDRNQVSGNSVRGNRGAGVTLLAETSAAAAIADVLPPAQRASVAAVDSDLVGAVAVQSTIAGNQIGGNTVASNQDDGVVLKAASNTMVQANTIEGNAGHGIYLASGASDNTIARNTTSGNHGSGIRVNGADAIRNMVSENAVFENAGGGVLVTSGANAGARPPAITAQQNNRVSGTAAPGAAVEIFSDLGWQGRYFEGRTTAQADGTFSLAVPGGWKAPHLNALATDRNGNTSAFANRSIMLYLPLVLR